MSRIRPLRGDDSELCASGPDRRLHVIAVAPLTPTAAFFQVAGYLRLPGLLPVAQVERLRDVVGRIATREHEHIRRSPEKTRMDHVVSHDSAFLEVATSE